jgi:hypothetical protein
MRLTLPSRLLANQLRTVFTSALLLSATVASASPPAAPEVAGPTTVQCTDCPPTRLADAQRALDDGLRAYRRGLAEDDPHALNDAVVLFRHGYAQSMDSVFLMHQANIDRSQGTCGEALQSYAAFVKVETQQKRFPQEAKEMRRVFNAFRQECTWRGTSTPAAVEKRLRAFAAAQAGKPIKVERTPQDGTLRIHCPIGVRCDDKADSRMFMSRDAGLQLQLLFAPHIVGHEATVDVAEAFQYADFNVLFPALSSTVWKAHGDSFRFLMRKGDPRIRSLTYKDGLLHIIALTDITDVQAASTVDKCMVSKYPKECFLHVPASIPLEFDLTLPIEMGPLNCKDKTIPDYAYRCG